MLIVKDKLEINQIMVELAKKYNFKDSEKKWQDFWKETSVYKWKDNASRDKTYVVDTPPPTVSGQLHIGHVYSYTQTDFIVRFKRMMGMDIFYPIGFDDNGLPTERLVEKQKKVKASGMDRDGFVKICKEVVKSEEEKFRTLFSSIALSVDWNLEYQTISPMCRQISQLSFIDLVNKDQVYRQAQPILWDPVDQTALSQADIEDKERSSFMNDIKFTLLAEDGSKTETLTIATTRPEMLAACVAVFFHPDDERYNHLNGRYALTPLFGVKVPLMADDMVKPDKGTGLVMCCTFGDQTDILWWRKHKLPCKIIINQYGKMIEAEFDDSCINPEKAKEYAIDLSGLKVKDAREKTIELLQISGELLRRQEITQTVKCAERSGAPLEIITTPQWFIKAIEHKDILLQRSNELQWHPGTMKIKLDSWINSIAWDWCISRQRYFGVPFPVWYSKRANEEGKPIFAKPEQLPVDPMYDLPEGYRADEVIPDIDVMDTWSTSSVSPQLSSHGVSKDLGVNKERHDKLFPADLRPQAHEIIRSWDFYTILKSQLHEQKLPWKNIMISGWCLAEDKTKMSKSKGNIVEPEKLIELYGSDVIRYWSSSSKLGADTAYSEDVMKNGKRLVSKIWNSAKFASQHLAKIDVKELALNINGNDLEESEINLEMLAGYITYDYDKYFIVKLSQLIEESTKSFESYEYASAMEKIERFFWQSFCDNYLEITKTRAYNEDEETILSSLNQEERRSGQISAILTLRYSLNILLRLFAPVLPHITEELYQSIYDQKTSIHNQGNWPKLNSEVFATGENELKGGGYLIEILDLVRKSKASSGLSIKTPIKILEIRFNEEQSIRSLTDNLILDLMNVTSSKKVVVVEDKNQKMEFEGQNVAIKVVYF